MSQLPVLEIEEPGIDKKYVIQPLAILRYLCKLGNLYPTEPIRALEVESMIDTIAEIQNLINISKDEAMQSLMSGSPWSENETWSVRRRIAKNREQGLPYVSCVSFQLSFCWPILADLSFMFMLCEVFELF